MLQGHIQAVFLYFKIVVPIFQVVVLFFFLRDFIVLLYHQQHGNLGFLRKFFKVFITKFKHNIQYI